MIKFLIRWIVAAIAVTAAVIIVPGIEVTDESAWVTVIVVAIIFGLVNATLGLVLKIGSFGCIIATFGLFSLVINALMLWLSAEIAQGLGIGFEVMGFWPAFWGAVVISIVSTLLNAFASDKDDRR